MSNTWLHIGAGDIQGLSSQMAKGLQKVQKFVGGTKDIYITHIRHGQHLSYSLHPFGHALDIRPIQGIKFDALKKLLGNEYDCVKHSTHWHIEYDPKGEK